MRNRRRDKKALWVGLVIGLAVFCPSCTDDSWLPSPDGDNPDGDATTPSGYCEPIGTPDTTVQQQMLDALNRYRVSNGLPELLYSNTLEAAASFHAENLYRRGFFDHYDPDGDGPMERAMDAGFCDPSWVGENIAAGYTSANAAQIGWQGSAGHRTNMLRTEFVFAGMGHYTSPVGYQYWVQVFGATFD